MSKLQKEMQERQHSPFKYVVFSGGGAKGAGYYGVYEGLNESKVSERVEAVARIIGRCNSCCSDCIWYPT